MSVTIRVAGRAEPVRAEGGASLLEVLRAAGHAVPADCNGRGTCGRCLIRLREGAERVPPVPAEADRIGEREAAEGFRLACQHPAVDGLEIEVVEEMHRQEVYKRLGIGLGHPLPLDPEVRRVDLEGDELEPALAAAGLTGDVDWAATLPEAGEPRFRKGPEAVARAALATTDGRVLGLASGGPAGRLLGVAVDLGTTTLAAYLCDFGTGDVLGVETARNPQARYGADVITRITAAQDAKVARELQSSALATLGECIRTVTRRVDAAARDLVELVLVGNPTMIHLLLGAPTRGLAHAPYRPVFRAGLTVRSRELDLPLHPGALVHTLPLPSAFVGADTLAAWLWVEGGVDERPTLLMDLGTNGEMILAARGGLWATSCATGPAFEGGGIHCGMPGVPGAIERVRVTDRGPEVDVIGRAVDPRIRARGLCGSGAVSAVAELLRSGHLKPDGAFDPARHSEVLRRGTAGVEYELAGAERAYGARPVVLTQNDVRALQLAKGAVATGIRFLCDAAGVEEPVRVLLAGAFGNLIDPEDAASLGLIPRLPPGAVEAVGNAAGLGACRALLDRRARARARDLLAAVEVVEMGGSSQFQRLYLQSLAFPEAAPPGSREALA